MEKLCPNCGETFLTLNVKKVFCCSQCGQQYRNRTKPRTIMNSFAVFKRIVQRAANYNEFKELWNAFFKEAKS